VIPSLALVLILIAAILFLTRQRHRRRAALLPNATLVAADNLERSCPVLVSTRYGLKGKPDAILQTPAGLIPIERKHARPPASPHFPDIIQAAAYCLLIEDAYQQTPPFMRIQYRDTIFDVPFTNERRNQVLAAAQRLRAVAPGTLCNRSHQIPAKCRSCGHRPNCSQAL
jgi:CRISPR-associated exonuclease Cas4